MKWRANCWRWIPATCAASSRTAWAIEIASLSSACTSRLTSARPESYDAVEIDGSPQLSMKFAGGIHGDIATASIVVNSIPKVLAATPGLHTMRDLALPSFFPGA